MSRNSIECNTKDIIRQGQKPEITARLIRKFANFNEEAILKALKEGGKEVSDIYANIIKFDKALK